MFYKLSWNGQLLAATTLFVISFLVEAEVLRRFLESPALAYPLAAALEASKALTIVLGRYFKSRGTLAYPAGMHLIQGLFRAGLILLSFAAAAFYFGTWADRPRLEAVRAADIAAEESRLAARREALTAHFDSRVARARAAVADRYERTVATGEKDFRATLADLERRLAAEMHVADDFGNFKGRRYRELQRRLEETRLAYQGRLDALSRAQGEAAADAVEPIEQARDSALAALDAEGRKRLDALRTADYEGDGRVYDPLINSAVAMVRQALGSAPTPLQLTFSMAFLVSLLMELGIWAGLEIVALSYLPVFEAEADADRSLRRKRVETEAELDAFRMDDAVLREKARVKAESADLRMRTFRDDEAA